MPAATTPSTAAEFRGPGTVRRRAAWRRSLGLGAVLAAAPAAVGQDAAPQVRTPAAQTAPAAADPGDLTASYVRLSEPRTKTEIVKTFSKRVVLPEGLRFTNADGYDENVATVTALDERTLRVFAASPGFTQIDMTATEVATGRTVPYRLDVLVAADARALQASIDRLFPGTAVEVHGLTDTSVVLRGWITRPEQVSQIVAVAGQYFPPENILNYMRVAAPQQVQLNVVFMEVQRSKARELGINLSWFGENGFFSSTVGDVVPLAGLAGGGSNATGIPLGGTPSLSFPAAAIANPTIAAGIVGSGSVFNAFLKALREERLLKVLSEPTQVASNGRPSYFQAGGEFPIPIPQGLGTVGIEYRPYGVELSAVPIILGGNRVRLELAASVSDLDFSRGTTLNGTTVPGLSQRQTNTQVELEFGKTLMIAGLIQNTQQAAAQKLPILGELPGVGALFRRVRYEEAETELVILVTPHPVAGVNPCDLPPLGPGRGSAAPTTRELFNLGLLEVPGGDPCGPGCAAAGGAACGCEVGGGGLPPGFDGGLVPPAAPQFAPPTYEAPQFSQPQFAPPSQFAPQPGAPAQGGFPPSLTAPPLSAPAMPAAPFPTGQPTYTSPPADGYPPVYQGAPATGQPPVLSAPLPLPSGAPAGAPTDPSFDPAAGPQAFGFGPGYGATRSAAAPGGVIPAGYRLPGGSANGRVTAPPPVRR